MKTSVNMKLIVVLFVFGIILSPINSMDASVFRPADQYQFLRDALNIYCPWTCRNQRDFRFCFIENGDKIILDFGINCVRQHLGFCQTVEKCCDLICENRKTNGQDYDDFIQCYANATYTQSFADCNVYSRIQECLETAPDCC
ncbi:uncharacterized protein LOC111612561 isoform X2 [Centruroides sculpturatus]|uniref:uncharacterized protein LOC111612561 isoform X2 n=1 Tax=Centruroides sculpturatus TaxID=218467 RepID=UPI000C6E7D0F|nr:uncharacterized protein LOC111612561 isoform X2 [Centruroides sculpturatus]